MEEECRDLFFGWDFHVEFIGNYLTSRYELPNEVVAEIIIFAAPCAPRIVCQKDTSWFAALFEVTT